MVWKDIFIKSVLSCSLCVHVCHLICPLACSDLPTALFLFLPALMGNLVMLAWHILLVCCYGYRILYSLSFLPVESLVSKNTFIFLENWGQMLAGCRLVIFLLSVNNFGNFFNKSWMKREVCYWEIICYNKYRLYISSMTKILLLLLFWLSLQYQKYIVSRGAFVTCYLLCPA